MNKLTRYLSFGTVGLMAFAAAEVRADGVWVINNSDAAAGSFRAAVLQANGDQSVTWIKFAPDVGTVTLAGTVEFTGPQNLKIDGAGATLKAGGGPFDLLVASGGGSLDLAQLTFADSAGSGMVVEIPPTQVADVSVSLFGVNFYRNSGYGLFINDEAGSAAGIGLVLERCELVSNGTEVTDTDGVRVTERKEGGISASIKECLFEANGADGIELDEAGEGDVSLTVLHSTFDANGFQDSTDVEDGIDVDEADAGNVYALIVDVGFTGNAQQGLDLNEAGAGTLVAELNQVSAINNGEEGLKFDEKGDGDVSIEINNAICDHNGYNSTEPQDGVQAKEAKDGDLFVRIVNSEITNSAKYGVNVEQGDPGAGLLFLQHTTVDANASGKIRAKLVDVIERGTPK